MSSLAIPATSPRAATLATSATLHVLAFLALLALVRLVPAPAPPPEEPRRTLTFVRPSPAGPAAGAAATRTGRTQPRKPPREKPPIPLVAAPLLATPAVAEPDTSAFDATGEAGMAVGEPGGTASDGTGTEPGDGLGDGTGGGGPDEAGAPEPRVITASVAAPELLERVEPEYPLPARVAKVDGQVKLRCVIHDDGSVEVVEVLRGHRLLRDAAADAVSRWRYAPATFEGRPVSVWLTVTVDFTLD